MEHHSNDLPWRKNFNVDYVEVDEEGRLKIDECEKKLKEHKGKIKYVSVTGASNVTGYLNDIHKIAEIAHKYKSKINMLQPTKSIYVVGICVNTKGATKYSILHLYDIFVSNNSSLSKEYTPIIPRILKIICGILARLIDLVNII